jgi:hypothetical protein
MARLDRFGTNKIFFMALFFIKWSRLVFTIRKPDLFVRFSNGKNRTAAKTRWLTIQKIRQMGPDFELSVA